MSIKIRSDDTDDGAIAIGEHIDDTVFHEERENLKETNPLVILDYIKNSFDILLNLKMESLDLMKREKSLKESKASAEPSARTAMESQLCSDADNNELE